MATSLAKAELKTALVEALYDDIVSNRNNYYYFVGNILNWNGNDIPLNVEDNVAYEQQVRRDIIFMKKITSADVIFSIPRYNWLPNTVFDQYDDNIGHQIIVTATGINNTTELTGNFADLVSTLSVGYTAAGTNIAVGSKIIQVTATKIVLDRRHVGPINGTVTFTNIAPSGATTLAASKMYCITSDFHVYKCLNNNNNSLSTVRPYSTSYQPVSFSDGYIWKYMYTVPKAFINKFTSNSNIPVISALKNSYYTSGALTNFIVENYGEGYTQSDVVVNVLGDGYLPDNPVKIIALSINDQGKGYRPGSGDDVYDNNKFDAYIQDPIEAQPFEVNTPYLQGSYVKASTGKIYEVTYPGTSSTNEPTHTGDNPIGNGTLQLKFVGMAPALSVFNGAHANQYGNGNSDSDVIAEYEMTGIVGEIEVTDPGFGYETEVNVTINAGGTGSGASATASPLNGRINKINMIDRGSNYDTATVVFESPINLTNIKRRYFDPSDRSSVIAYANMLYLKGHGYQTGDIVTYRTNGNTSIHYDWVDGQKYYVIKVNDDYLKITNTKAKTTTNQYEYTFNPTNTSEFKPNNSLIIAPIFAGYFVTGDAVLYTNGGGTSIPGLVNNTVYFYIRVSNTQFQLASSYQDAIATTVKTFDGSSSSVVTINDTASNANTIVIPSHGFKSGDKVIYAYPTGGNALTFSKYSFTDSDTEFYIRKVDDNTILLTNNYNNAVAATTSVSFTGQSSTNISTDIITSTNHGFADNDPVIYYHNGTAIGGLTNGQKYYVQYWTANSFKLKLNSTTTTAINLTSTGGTTTTHTFSRAVNITALGTGTTHTLTLTGKPINLLSGATGTAHKIAVLGTGLYIDDYRVDEGQLQYIERNFEWEPEYPVTLGDYVVSGTRTYKVTATVNTNGTGILGLNSPTHRSGTMQNGTVDLELIGITATGQAEIYYGYGYSTAPQIVVEPPVIRDHIWNSGATVASTNIIQHENNFYRVTSPTGGELGTTPPVHTTLTKYYIDVVSSTKFRLTTVQYDNNTVVNLTDIGGATTNHTFTELSLLYDFPVNHTQVSVSFTGGSGIDLVENTITMPSNYFPDGLEVVYYHNGVGIGGLISSSVENGDVHLTYIGRTATINSVVEKTSAKVAPIVESGQLLGIISTHPGIGYTTASLQVTSGSGFGAVIKPVLSIGDIQSRQANVELLAVPGTIDAIKIINPGSRYYGSPTVTIVGDGTGATARAITQSGIIEKIEVINRGSNYTYATVVIAGPSVEYQDGVQAYARAVVSPIAGHGANAVSELNANGLIIAMGFSDEKNQGITVNNDFRRIGILKNPSVYNKITRFNEMSGSGCFLVTGAFNYSYLSSNEDALMTNVNGKQFRLVSLPNPETQIDGYNTQTEAVTGQYSILVQSVDNASIQANDILFYGTNFSTRVITVKQPTVDKYSGQMMFIDNRAAFAPSIEQTVSFKTTIKL